MLRWLAVGLAVLLASGAFAAPISYVAQLSGANHNPASGSLATGTATLVIDTAVHTIQLSVTYSGIASGHQAFLHCCVTPPGNVSASTAALPFFPSANSGTYNVTLNMLSTGFWSQFFVQSNGNTFAGAEAAFAPGLAAGRAYFNIVSNNFPNGEIRGFFMPLPEPGFPALVASAAAMLAWSVRRPKRAAR
jgi:hypothetical protein